MEFWFLKDTSCITELVYLLRLAAFFHDGEFICGGSLISTKLIVTAAHCVQNKEQLMARKPEDASFYIGKHDITTLAGEKNYIIANALKFIVHPDWSISKDASFDADIAIAVLYNVVLFSKFVKPICLPSARDIVGESGTIAGWGKTELNTLPSATPRWVDIPVVDMLSCIRSNSAFVHITSNRTFCAGNDIDSGPCNGDSGKLPSH